MGEWVGRWMGGWRDGGRVGWIGGAWAGRKRTGPGLGARSSLEAGKVGERMLPARRGSLDGWWTRGGSENILGW